MQLKKCLSSILALAVVLNTGAISAMAAGNSQERGAQTQTSSNVETVYVNAYSAGERSVSFNDHWRFSLGEANGAEAVSYNDASWENVTLPHDYSIDQGFTVAAPAEQENGYVLGGTGWYRKAFTLSDDVQGKVVSVDFDGVYMNATVYINGEKLGTHPYGYTPFSFVLPESALKFGGAENVLAVKVEHKQPSSRWYSGSGIYRDVNLTVTEPVHVAYYGTAVTTPDIAEGKGTVQVAAEIKNDGNGAASVSVKQTVYELDGTEPVAEGEKTQAQSVAAGETAKITDTVTVAEPKLWDTENPNMYTVRTEVYVNDTLTDTYDSDFGFRWVEFTTENGFFLNGENRKLRGVCMHHDQGALGAEAWRRAVERQVEMMQEMGVNAIRVTHNPASQALIDICNRKGMMLVEESFDCWLSGKDENTEDYGKWFDTEIEEGNQITGAVQDEKWCEFDVKAMVRRGRNAPAIIMWSLGNELFQSTISGSRHGEYPDVAKNLFGWVNQEDATRYVTFGDNQFKGQETNGSSNATKTAWVFTDADQYGFPGGLPGYNYGWDGQIQNGHNQGWLVYGSETASSVNSRGVYDRKNNCSDDGSGDRRLTSYDKSKVSWGHLAAEGLWITMRQAFNAGEFVWTGFDYIGEPTPYNWTGTGSNGTWPNVSKSSYFGIVDTAGFEKDSFYLYQSQWNDKVNTLHILPVWNEDEIMIDSNGKVEVVVYSDAPVIKLYLNGKEVGTATAVHTDTPTGGYQNYTAGTGCFDSSKASGSTSLYATFNVPFEEGKLEAKAFEADGKRPIAETEGRSYVETTGAGYRLEAEADREVITANGKDLSYVTIDVTDAEGRFVNGAEPQINVTVEGDGKLLALDNGVQNDTTSYGEPSRKAGKGKLLAIVQSTDEAGSFTVTATSSGYMSGSVTVTTEADDSEVSGERKVVSYEIAKNYYVKQGEQPVLPTEVKVNYSDDTSETKTVAWDEIPAGGDSYTVTGTIQDINLQAAVNVTMIGEVAAVLNYSVAVGRNAQLSLPASRPAVLADGTVLTAEFPVVWDTTENVTAQTGTKIVNGTAQVFDQEFGVTASVRVTDGTYEDGPDALPGTPEIYVNGDSSKEDSEAAAVMSLLRDDKTAKDDDAWSGKGTIDFRLDTAVTLKGFTLYLRDSAPTSDTMKIYSSADNGVNWTQADCKVTNRREDGVTVRTFMPQTMISETMFRVEFTKRTSVLELEINTKIPGFPIGAKAELSSLQVGGHIADQDVLERGWYGIADTELSEADVEAAGMDHAAVTVLKKDSKGIITILLESEDHAERGMYQVLLGTGNDVEVYASADMTMSAPSEESSGSAAKAADGKDSTIWHSRWGSGGNGSTDLTDRPEERYLQIGLKESKKISAVSYLPRQSQYNGTVTEYRIEVSTDGNNWETVSKGSWAKDASWKRAVLDTVTEAKYIRLYGVRTASDDGTEDNKFMSAAEVHVLCVTDPADDATELYSGNTSVTLNPDTFPYTGKEITPEPVVTYQASADGEAITLAEGTDYELDYSKNTEPGTAVITVKGIGMYSGIVQAAFTIEETDVEIISYEQVNVTTAKGEQPNLPGLVTAQTNVGEQLMEARWDKVGGSMLNTFGTFTVYGTVVDTGARIPASVTVSDVTGVQQVTLATKAGRVPDMPEEVTVYYSNGETEKKAVTWELEDVSFDAAGIVEVAGMAGKAAAKASVRVEEAEADANATPEYTNLALNADGRSKPKEWPRTFAYVAPDGDPAYYATDGVKAFVSTSSKKIWSDWESGKYHTNADAAAGASDHLPFVVSAFGTDGSTDSADQKKYTVNKVSIGFMEEDIASDHKVRLPADYKIEYYSGNDGVIDASRLENASAAECSNVKSWGSDNPLKTHDGWTEVTYTGTKTAVPELADFKHMVDVTFESVETTAIRITLTPQAENWTGLEEFEVYYVPVEEKTDYTVQSIQVDGQDVLAQFDEETKTLDLDAEGGEITAAATNNASVTILDVVEGTAKVIFLPENGDEAKKAEYTVNFTKAQDGYVVSAQDDLVEIENDKAAEGEKVSFRAADGYVFEDTPGIAKSSDDTETGIEVTEENGSYSFIMPDYPVSIHGSVAPEIYQITYELDGGTAENPASYTIETRTFTLKNPVKENYVFIGWTSGTVTEPTSQMSVKKGTFGELNFKANWRAGTTYTVSFDSNGGSAVPSQEVTVDSVMTEPDAPVKRGYEFAGWYRDAELTNVWNFAENRVTQDMTLHAKWSEAEIRVNTELPARLMGGEFKLPENISVTAGGETFDTAVNWNTDDVAAVTAASEVGSYSVRGTIEELEGREIEVTILVSPGDVIYFVDSGASAFTAKGKVLAEVNKATMKNTVPDQAYDSAAGWGFTNPGGDLEVHSGSDAYESIRNFQGGVNGKTLTYQFALKAGTYRVAAGFYDPWAQYANGKRHAKVSLTDEAGTELAAKADHNISGAKDTVEFTNITLTEDCSVKLNVIPRNTGSDNNDVMISFIVITGEENNIPDAASKRGLEAAISIADALDKDEYTEDSYQALADALEAAREAYAAEGLSEEEIQRHIDALSEAVAGLVCAGKAETPGLISELEQKQQELAEKIRELEAANTSVENLTADLREAEAEVTRLTGELNTETQRVEALTTELNETKQAIEDLKDTSEFEALQNRVEELQSQIESAQNRAAELEGELAEAKKQAEILRASLTETNNLIETLEAERTSLENAIQALREAEKKALEDAQKAKDEIERLKAANAVQLKNGDTVTVKGMKYRVTNAEKKQACAYGAENKNLRTITVASKVTINGVSCQVTAVANNAFANLKKAAKAVIGSNVTTIGKKAFYGDKKLKKITVKSKKLKSIGNGALKGISAKAVVKVPKAKRKAYNKLFKGKGQKKSVKIK